MRKDEIPSDLILSESQLRQVIELAARMPARSEGVTLAELRQIAHELDIDQHALDQALQEVLAKPAVRLRVTRLGHQLARHGRAIVGALIGGSLGWLSGHLTAAIRDVIGGVTVMRGSGAFIDVPLAIALIVLTILNSFSRRTEGLRGEYLRDTLATWTSVLVARSLTDGFVTQDGMRFVLLALLGLGLWGWLIIRPRPRLDTPTLRAVAHDISARPPVPALPNDTKARIRLKEIVLPLLLRLRFPDNGTYLWCLAAQPNPALQMRGRSPNNCSGSPRSRQGGAQANERVRGP